MKALGTDINEFFNNHWPGEKDEYYYDGAAEWLDSPKYFKNDDLNLEPSEKYELNDFGFFGSNDTNPVRDTANILGDTFEAVFRKWLKTRSVTTFVVEVPNDKTEAFREFAAYLSIKIIK